MHLSFYKQTGSTTPVRTKAGKPFALNGVMPALESRRDTCTVGTFSVTTPAQLQEPCRKSY